MARMPAPIEPFDGVSYRAEFTKVDKATVALNWKTRDRDKWKKILEAVKKLPERQYNGATQKWEVPWNELTRKWIEASGWKDPPKEKDPNEVREDPRIKQQAKIDATKLDPEGTLIPGLRPYQIDFLKFAQLRHGRLALGDEMGCVWGDMAVQVRKDGKERKISLETLYREFSKTKETADWGILCYCHDFMYDMPYGEIVDVVQSGIKRCVHATLEDDTYLVATPDHKVLTENGWVEIKDTLNDYIEVEKNGRTELARVVSITSAGMRMTYDVKVLNYGNFVANHIVVHNCGKTVEALSWMVYANAYPALYVVNAPTKLQWQEAYRKWVGATKKHYPDVEVLNGKTPHPLSKDKSYIINWDVLSDWTGHYKTEEINGEKITKYVCDGPLTKVGFRLLVGDEVQAISNPDSQRATAFKALSEIIPHCIGMSGTPAMSKPLQFWTLLSIVEPSRFKNFYFYKNRYCDPQTNEFGTTYNGASNIEELHGVLVNCMLRRTKAEVMKDLPPKVMEVVPLEVDSSDMKAYYEEEREVFSEDTEKGEVENARNKVAHLLRTAYALKEKSMLDWIDDFLESGRKLLLFAWHRSVVEVLVDELKMWCPAMIYGGLSPNDREAARKKFIENPKCKVMVANIQAGGVGIDGFQDVCSDVAFAEFSHTPNYHRQAEDRLHRSGQKNSVTSYYLVAPGTVDMDAIEILDSRAKMLDGVLDGKETATTDLLTELMERRGLRMPK